MYQRFAEIKGWTVEVMSMTDGGNVYGHDGVKEVTMKISSGSDEVYGQLQWESGVHRVQRIPPNDAKGRIQTSTVSIIVSLVQKASSRGLACDSRDRYRAGGPERRADRGDAVKRGRWTGVSLILHH
jgi:protein subunit release factor A